MTVKIEYLAEQLVERVLMLWEFQTPVTFQDKVKAEELREALNERTYKDMVTHAYVSKKR